MYMAMDRMMLTATYQGVTLTLLTLDKVAGILADNIFKQKFRTSGQLDYP